MDSTLPSSAHSIRVPVVPTNPRAERYPHARGRIVVSVSRVSASVTTPGLTRASAATIGGYRLRVAPWHGKRHIALIGPARVRRSPTVHEIGRCLRTVEKRGVGLAFTPALSPFEAEPFFQAGFELHEELHLLARSLGNGVPEPAHRLRPGRPWDRRRVLDIDARAFDSFWQFDKFSLREARQATPTSRFMVAQAGRKVVGYAVTGRAGRRGYLQRLAVDPSHAGQGIGSSLVNDCFAWLESRSANMVMVNTQHSNSRALALYEHLGFVRQREGLLVLRWTGTD